MDFSMFEGPTMIKIWKDPSEQTNKKQGDCRRKDGHDQVLVKRQQAVWRGSRSVGAQGRLP